MERMVAGGIGRLAPEGNVLTGQDGNKDAACWKMCTSYFRA